MSSKVRKIYVDSRHKTDDSDSTSSFKMQLPQTYRIPENTGFYITDVCIPHAWRQIEEGMNNKLYYAYRQVNGTWVNICRTITPGVYSNTNLVDEINRVFNLNFAIYPRMITYDDANKCILFTNTAWFAIKFFSPRDLESVTYWIEDLDGGTFRSCASVMGILKTTIIEPDTTIAFSPIKSQAIDNVYITSPNLGSFDTVAYFSNNVIKKTPVTSRYGFMIVDQYNAPNDYLDCFGQTLNTLEFHLRTGTGDCVNLRGYRCSFSIVLIKFNFEE